VPTALPALAFALAVLAARPALASAAPAPVPRDPIAERTAAALAELERDRQAPRAIVPLSRLHALEGEAPDLSKLARAYAQVAEDRRALPEVRALARVYLAGVERKRGSLQRSAAELKKLAFVRDWWIVGPFDNEGKRGFEAVYPPEEALDLSGRYPGKAREVAWRQLPPEAGATGYVALGAVLRPVREVAAYALAVVESPREQRAQIWLGASGAVKLWVNGVQALADPAYHPARLDQAAVAVTLRRGPNRLLLKLCNEGGELGFLLRIADAGGSPLALAPARVPPLPPLARGGAERPERVQTVVQALERRARAAGKAEEAAARLDLALALAERRSDDSRERRAAEEARRAAALAPGSVEALLLAARLEEDDPNRRREYLEAALAKDPDDPLALAALAGYESHRGRPQQAVRLLERAAAAAPGYAPARVALLQAREQSGLSARAAVEAGRLPREIPLSPGAAAAAARAARGLDRVDEAATWLRKVLGLRYDDETARGTLAQILVDRGDLEGALGLLSVAERLDPADLQVRLRRADLLSSNGRAKQAEAAYAEAARICPEEPEVFERRGHARLRAGRQAEALADFQRALELRPQNPQLKELVRLLEPERERFEKPYLLDAAALVREAPAPGPEDDAVVLGELKVTRVFPSGMSATYQQLVVKVFTPRGADDWRSHTMSFTPDRQELRVDRVRVTRPDGSVLETYQESERSTSEPWYRLYFDTRARTVTVPTLSPGDVLEIAYRMDDVGKENLLSDYFGDVTLLAGQSRRARAEYVLLMPQGRKIHAGEQRIPGLSRAERTLPGGVVEHRWSARDLPRLQPEPGMPGWGESMPYIHVSTYADWSQVARFYWGLVRDQLRPDAQVRQAAERIAAGVPGARRPPGGPPLDRETELALVRAVYDFVVTNIRYVGLEFGIHGYKPYRVDQVLQRRFGDCKDKASLMHALLEVLGIDSRLVLLRMRHLGTVPAAPASLAVFNHAILHVPKYDLWLDGTAAYSGSRELPGDDREATVLVVNPDAPPRFGEVPPSRPEDNRTVASYRVALAADGSAAIQGESRIAGERAPVYRRSYQAESDRLAASEQLYSRAYPGLRVEEVSVTDPARIEEDVVLRVRLAVARYAQPDGQGLRFVPFGRGHSYAESFAAFSARRYDLVLGQPWESAFTYRHDLPAGYAVVESPEAASRDTPFGTFEVRYRAEGGALLAEGRVVFRASRVAVADYPAFRDFVTAIDRALSRPVRVGPAPLASEPAGAGGSR
jgi:tetratricopeptide (TPR) repeat protein/transglutaminase-like putative cysteine protease